MAAAAAAAASHLLKLPLIAVQRAHLARLEPAADAEHGEPTIRFGSRDATLRASHRRDAPVEMESVIACPPRDGTLRGRFRGLICLTFNAWASGKTTWTPPAQQSERQRTQIHNVVSANRTGIHCDIPSPQSDGVPETQTRHRRRLRA